jgi:hypothetical protein
VTTFLATNTVMFESFGVDGGSINCTALANEEKRPITLI